MPITAFTPSMYATVVTGYLPGTGTTTGSIVTFTTPIPVWGTATNTTDLQNGAVTLGGFNGLNN
jgi:hypothetical protein